MSNVDGAANPAEGISLVKKKTKIRGGHRAHLTKLITKISGYLGDYAESRHIEILANRNALETKGSLLGRLDEEILVEIENDEDIEDEIEECEKIQLQIKMKILEVDIFLKKVEKATEKKRDPVVTAAESRRALKLPTLKIKDFGGDPKELHHLKMLLM